MKSEHTRLHEALLQIALQPRAVARWLGRLTAGGAPQGMTVIALDGQWLKLLQVEGPIHGRQVTKVLACPVERLDPAALQQAFMEACATEGVTPRDVLVANPTHLCTIRLFSLPSVDPKEIRDIVDLQAEKHTPYAKEEILTDFRIIDRDASGYSRVLLIIAHQDVVHRPVQLVERAGWLLERVGCELEGLINWFEMTKAPASAAVPTLVVDVDGTTTTLLVMHRSQPQFHRSVATGADQLVDDPAQAGERLVGEISRSLEALEAEGSAAKVQEILLTGRVERLSELQSVLQRGLSLPVNLAPPWGPQALSAAVQAAYARLPDVSFASLFGLAAAPSRIDLTPQATKLRQAFEAKAKALVLLGCQGIAMLILLSLLIIGRTQREQRYYQQLRAFYDRSTLEAQQVEESLRQTELVKAQLRRRGQLLEAATTLAQRSPPEIRWHSLAYIEDGQVVLKGTSKQLPNIYEFVAGLDGLELFGQVETRRVAKRSGEEEGMTDFEIVCPFAGAGTEPAS